MIRKNKFLKIQNKVEIFSHAYKTFTDKSNFGI